MSFLIDTHAHLYSEEFEIDVNEVIDKALAAGIKKILLPNVDEHSIAPMIEIEQNHRGVCHAMLGLHPCYVKENYLLQLNQIEKWFDHHNFIAIGEIGLDLYHDTTYFAQQQKALETQAQWAIDRKLPLVIHCRKSTQETIDILKSIHPHYSGIFHCFSGTIEQAFACIKLGFKLGIGGVITFKNSGLDKIVQEVGIEHLVLETDSPYLAPTPFRGKRNEPAYLSLVAQKVADILDLSVEMVTNYTYLNTRNVFNI
jgi:TatD DNase family protein